MLHMVCLLYVHACLIPCKPISVFVKFLEQNAWSSRKHFCTLLGKMFWSGCIFACWHDWAFFLHLKSPVMFPSGKQAFFWFDFQWSQVTQTILILLCNKEIVESLTILLVSWSFNNVYFISITFRHASICTLLTSVFSFQSNLYLVQLVLP